LRKSTDFLPNAICWMVLTNQTIGKTNLQSLINTSTAINHIVTEQLAPNNVEPTGLTLQDAQAALARLSGDGSVTIVPTADITAPAPAPTWNIWVDGRYSWIDDTIAYSDLDGSLTNFVVGADYKISDNAVFGLMGTYETSDREGSGFIPPTISTEGWGVGAYMGVNLTSQLVWSSNVNAAWIDTDVNDGALLSDSLRWQAASALTGYFYSGTWRFSPSVGVAWSHEVQEDRTGSSPDVIFESAVLTPGFQLGNTVAVSDTVTVEPWAGAQLDWAFINTGELDGFGTLLDDPYTDLRLQAGVNFALGPQAQLALTAEMSGLLLDDNDTYTAGANFAVQF
jgi:Autotransporter beta-domain